MTKKRRSNYLAYIVTLPIAFISGIISCLLGIILVAVVFVIVCVVVQWVSSGIGIFAAPPWEVMTFFEDGRFIFEMSPPAFDLMNLTSRWLGAIGGGFYAIYIYNRFFKKKRVNSM